MEFKQRFNALKKLIKNKKAKRIILKSEDPNFYWLFGKNIDGAIAIVSLEKIVIVAKPLEYVPKIFLKKPINLIKIKKSSELKNHFKNQKGTSLVNYDFITLRDKKNLNLKKTIDCSFELEELRSQKTNDEIKKIKTACKHVVNCWKQILKKLKNKELRTEKQIEKHIKKYALEKNLGLAFSPVVASGKNAGTPHHVPGNKLNKGFLVIDFGFDFEGYKSDMTRTIYLGKPEKKEKETYNELLNVQETMIQKIKTGKSAEKIYQEALQEMKKPELFTHGLGHGVGIQIHECPSMRQDSTHIIKNNNVLTIEPGYYTNKFGIRIEDTILIQEKPVILTKTSKKLVIIR